EHDPRIGARAAGVERHINGNADDGDVHLGARDEAQIGAGLARLWLWYLERDDKLALGERGLARPGDDVLDRNLTLSVRSGDDRDAARRDDRGHAVRRGGGVAQIAGDRGAALDLGRADQIDALDDPR